MLHVPDSASVLAKRSVDKNLYATDYTSFRELQSSLPFICLFPLPSNFEIATPIQGADILKKPGAQFLNSMESLCEEIRDWASGGSRSGTPGLYHVGESDNKFDQLMKSHEQLMESNAQQATKVSTLQKVVEQMAMNSYPQQAKSMISRSSTIPPGYAPLSQSSPVISCTQCGGPHDYEQCPQLQELKAAAEANYLTNNSGYRQPWQRNMQSNLRYSNTDNIQNPHTLQPSQNYRPQSNFQGGQRQYQQQPYGNEASSSRPTQSPSNPESEMSQMQEMFKAMMGKSRDTQEEVTALRKDQRALQSQIQQLLTQQRPPGQIPSQTNPNPKEYAKAIYIVDQPITLAQREQQPESEMVPEVEQQAEEEYLDMNQLKLYAKLVAINEMMEGPLDLTSQQPESKLVHIVDDLPEDLSYSISPPPFEPEQTTSNLLLELEDKPSEDNFYLNFMESPPSEVNYRYFPSFSVLYPENEDSYILKNEEEEMLTPVRTSKQNTNIPFKEPSPSEVEINQGSSYEPLQKDEDICVLKFEEEEPSNFAYQGTSIEKSGPFSKEK